MVNYYKSQLATRILLTLLVVLTAVCNAKLQCPFGCRCEAQEISASLGIDCRALKRSTGKRRQAGLDSGSDFNHEQFANQLKSMSSNMSHSDLISLEITNTPLTQVPRFFCRLSTLYGLHLDNNQLTELPDNCFSHLEHLFTLSASRNKIRKLQNGLFTGLRHLRYLDLSKNSIFEIGLRVFSNISDTISLLSIDLSYNNLTTLEPWPILRGQLGFDQARVMIWLRHNNISKLTNHMRWGTSCRVRRSFLYLNLTDNPIRSVIDIVDGWDFMSFSTDVCLYRPAYTLFFNATYYAEGCIDYPLNALIEATFPFKNISQCFCGSTYYEYWYGGLKAHSFSVDINFVCYHNDQCPPGCRCVRRILNDDLLHVKCSNTNVSDLPLLLPELPKSYTKYYLDFSNNQLLKRLQHRDYFSNTSILDISDCDISDIPLGVWQDISTMKRVSMYGNSLTSFGSNVTTIPMSPSLSIGLGRNPWNCSCENRWMSGWLRSINQSIQNIDGLLCASPIRLRGKSIIRISHEEFCHNPTNKSTVAATAAEKNTDRTPSVIMAIMWGLFIVLLSVAIIAYRLRIKVYIKWKFHPFDRDECLGENMDFDLFLSCSSDDNLPFGNDIREQLEQRGYRVCYPPRDFVVGESIFVNIYNAVVHSKRTVCLLTSNFLQSVYCMYEFDVAFHHNIILKRKKRLIVLMALENPSELYSNDTSTQTIALRQYLHQYTYIEYAADDWLSRLLYAMPLRGMGQQQEYATTLQDTRL